MKLGAEGDLLVGVTAEGTPIGHGVLASRLRDMARHGMLYSPSRDKAARQRVVPQSYLEALRAGGRPEIDLGGEFGKLMVDTFKGEVPRANHYQWDAIFADGDLHKSGLRGQGTYVSPSKDLVIAWFSTVPATDLPGYARRIATTVGAPE